MCKLSIIIPHYNSPEMLTKLLGTIPKSEEIQTIVVDDNSTKYLDEYNLVIEQFPYVNFLKNTSQNKGAGSARNTGLKIAKGDWLLFADSDDFFIEGFYDIVKEYFDSEYDIVHFTPTSMEIDTGKISERHLKLTALVNRYIEDPNEENEREIRYMFQLPWSKLIHHDFIKKHNITFSETIVSNDVIFSVKAGHYARKIAGSDKIIYCVTKSRGTLTTSISKERLHVRLDILIEKCNFLKTVLNKKDIAKLNFNGNYYISQVIKGNLGIKTLFEVCAKLAKNKIKIISTQNLRHTNLIAKTKHIIKSYKNDDKYIQRQ